MDVIKKEIKDEITHILYDQTRRTPIVIPVINEIGGGLKAPARAAAKSQPKRAPAKTTKTTKAAKPARATAKAAASSSAIPPLPRRRFPAKQVPDSEANDTKARERQDVRGY